jgi:hypothetical protein
VRDNIILSSYRRIVMKHLFIYPLFVLMMGFIFWGCSDQQSPTAIDEEVSSLSKVDRVEYTVDLDLATLPPYEGCPGEDFQPYGLIKVHVVETTTPSGNFIVNGYTDYFADEDGVWIEGLTSGDIWTLYKANNPWHEFIKENGYYLLKYQWHEWYRNDVTGETLRVFVKGHVLVTPKGGLKIEREITRCF